MRARLREQPAQDAEAGDGVRDCPAEPTVMPCDPPPAVRTVRLGEPGRDRRARHDREPRPRHRSPCVVARVGEERDRREHRRRREDRVLERPEAEHPRQRLAPTRARVAHRPVVDLEAARRRR